ncbi:MAG: zinc metalloprotease HtpX [Candidatus Obscuribacterales bacterium]|nr:zinc metalloprotease HtpX [Candidatus Obscuribacterales bacterium]
MNTLKTILLMGILTALIVFVGGVIGGERGLYIAFAFAVLTNVGSYWFSDTIALKMSGAQPVTREESPELYEIVEGLAKRAQIPVPRIYAIPTDSPNAFATGRDPQHAAIAVTEGIMRIMNKRELAAVLAHELGHVRNRDVLITTMAAVLASVVTMIAHFGYYLGGNRDDRNGGGNPLFSLLLVILAPIAATLINLAISRAREYQADKTGAEITQDPEALANALAKLDKGSQQIPFTNVNPALSSLYIVKPNPDNWFINLYSTHPPIMERIKRLEEMEKS